MDPVDTVKDLYDELIRYDVIKEYSEDEKDGIKEDDFKKEIKELIDDTKIDITDPDFDVIETLKNIKLYRYKNKYLNLNDIVEIIVARILTDSQVGKYEIKMDDKGDKIITVIDKFTTVAGVNSGEVELAFNKNISYEYKTALVDQRIIDAIGIFKCLFFKFYNDVKDFECFNESCPSDIIKIVVEMFISSLLKPRGFTNEQNVVIKELCNILLSSFNYKADEKKHWTDVKYANYQFNDDENIFDTLNSDDNYIHKDIENYGEVFKHLDTFVTDNMNNIFELVEGMNGDITIGKNKGFYNNEQFYKYKHDVFKHMVSNLHFGKSYGRFVKDLEDSKPKILYALWINDKNCEHVIGYSLYHLINNEIYFNTYFDSILFVADYKDRSTILNTFNNKVKERLDAKDKIANDLKTLLDDKKIKLLFINALNVTKTLSYFDCYNSVCSYYYNTQVYYSKNVFLYLEDDLTNTTGSLKIQKIVSTLEKRKGDWWTDEAKYLKYIPRRASEKFKICPLAYVVSANDIGVFRHKLLINLKLKKLFNITLDDSMYEEKDKQDNICKIFVEALHYQFICYDELYKCVYSPSMYSDSAIEFDTELDIDKNVSTTIGDVEIGEDGNATPVKNGLQRLSLKTTKGVPAQSCVYYINKDGILDRSYAAVNEHVYCYDKEDKANKYEMNYFKLDLYTKYRWSSRLQDKIKLFGIKELSADKFNKQYQLFYLYVYDYHEKDDKIDTKLTDLILAPRVDTVYTPIEIIHSGSDNKEISTEFIIKQILDKEDVTEITEEECKQLPITIGVELNDFKTIPTAINTATVFKNTNDIYPKSAFESFIHSIMELAKEAETMFNADNFNILQNAYAKEDQEQNGEEDANEQPPKVEGGDMKRWTWVDILICLIGIVILIAIIVFIARTIRENISRKNKESFNINDTKFVIV